jgi:hypothetical protein
MEWKNNPWETPEGRAIWKDGKGNPSEVRYWEWLRGALRRLWSDYPLRKEWKKRQLRPLTKEEKESKLFHPSTKNVGQCSYCLQWFAGSKLECDHKVESEGCTSKETAESFLWHCGGRIGDDFRMACKACHKIRSYQQRIGGSFEEAQLRKQAIVIQDTKKDKEWLTERGIAPGKNSKIRKQQIIDRLREEKNNGNNNI